jgi:hypothetical protein
LKEPAPGRRHERNKIGSRLLRSVNHLRIVQNTRG